MNLAVMVTGSNLAILREGLTQAHDLGFHYVQLGLPAVINEDELATLAHTLTELGLTVVAVDAYENPLHPAVAGPGAALVHGIRHARELGCDLVITWSGTRNADLFQGDSENATEHTWQATVDHFQRMALVARENGVRIAIEPFHNHVASTPERVRDLLAAIGAPNVGCVVDPPNVIKAPEIDTINARLDAIVDTLAPIAFLAHAKDIRHPEPGETGVRDSVLDGVGLPPPGGGIMDYSTYLRGLERHGIEFLVLEHHSRENLPRSLDWVREHLPTTTG